MATRASVGATPGLAWSWSGLVRGQLLGAPAAAVAAVDVQVGAVLAIGVVPVAAVPLPPQWRGRVAVGLAGCLGWASRQCSDSSSPRCWSGAVAAQGEDSDHDWIRTPSPAERKDGAR